VDAGGRRVIPGLNDSHLHAIRGGLQYNLELRWDGVDSLQLGLEMIHEQAKRTPEGHWVRVMGGWSPFQFTEKRMPTVAELTEAPEVPSWSCAPTARCSLTVPG
jgi:predicted amidohydrolase YtcJ